MTTTVTNKPGPAAHAGRRFTAKIVDTGDRYGRNKCLTNDGDPMIEFYDATYADDPRFDPKGQFVSRYYIRTILERDGFGLDLDGGIDVWTIDAEAMTEVRAWLADQPAAQRPTWREAAR